MSQRQAACSEDSRSIVAEGCQVVVGVTGAHTDLVSQAVVSREELLSDVCAVCQLPIVASSKQEDTCTKIEMGFGGSMWVAQICWSATAVLHLRSDRGERVHVIPSHKRLFRVLSQKI